MPSSRKIKCLRQLLLIFVLVFSFPPTIFYICEVEIGIVEESVCNRRLQNMVQKKFQTPTRKKGHLKGMMIIMMHFVVVVVVVADDGSLMKCFRHRDRCRPYSTINLCDPNCFVNDGLLM